MSREAIILKTLAERLLSHCSAAVINLPADMRGVGYLRAALQTL